MRMSYSTRRSPYAYITSTLKLCCWLCFIYIRTFLCWSSYIQLQTLHRILRYLKMTLAKGLFFQKLTKSNIEMFKYANWIDSVANRKSTSNYCSFVLGNWVIWHNKKQSVVVCSSAEVELWAMAKGIFERIWLNKLLKELWVPMEHPMKLFCDS